MTTDKLGRLTDVQITFIDRYHFKNARLVLVRFGELIIGEAIVLHGGFFSHLIPLYFFGKKFGSEIISVQVIPENQTIHGVLARENGKPTVYLHGEKVDLLTSQYDQQIGEKLIWRYLFEVDQSEDASTCIYDKFFLEFIDALDTFILTTREEDIPPFETDYSHGWSFREVIYANGTVVETKDPTLVK